MLRSELTGRRGGSGGEQPEFSAERGPDGDGPDRSGPTGDPDVTGRESGWAWFVAALGPVAFAGLNIWTRLHDDPRLVRDGRAWEAVTWEVSSAVSTLALMGLASLAARVFSDRPWPRSLMPVAGLATIFVILHIATFVLLRKAVYLALGDIYEFGGWRAWLYEAPKDAVTFAILLAIFQAFRAFGSRQAQSAQDRTPPEIVMREGGRIHVVRPFDVLAVSAAGNYVEVRLVDGQVILWRKSLTEVQRMLDRAGFVRTHRSWLVNRTHVKAVKPVGSGDREIVLSPQLSVPLSRRFSDVLDQLTGERVS